MGDKTGLIRSEVQAIAEAAVRIDRLVTDAKELAIKLKATSDAFNSIAMKESEDDA
jgi:hypothetical protein